MNQDFDNIGKRAVHSKALRSFTKGLGKALYAELAFMIGLYQEVKLKLDRFSVGGLEETS